MAIVWLSELAVFHCTYDPSHTKLTDSLVPRLPRSGTWTLKLCRLGEPDHLSNVKFEVVPARYVFVGNPTMLTEDAWDVMVLKHVTTQLQFCIAWQGRLLQKNLGVWGIRWWWESGNTLSNPQGKILAKVQDADNVWSYLHILFDTILHCAHGNEWLLSWTEFNRQGVHLVQLGQVWNILIPRLISSFLTWVWETA